MRLPTHFRPDNLLSGPGRANEPPPSFLFLALVGIH